jgi:hypothetical protein
LVVGDVWVAPLTVSPQGYTLILNGDGTCEDVCGQDNSRKTFQYFVLRSQTGILDGPGTIWIDEVAPIWNSTIFLNNQVIGQPIASLNLASPTYAQSPSGDVLTFAIASGALPPGINLSSAGVLSGISGAFGAFSFTISATDITGMFTVSPASQIIINGVFVPNVSVPPLTEAAADALISASSLNYSNIPVTSSTVQPGLVANQSPSAGVAVTINSVVVLGISQGAQVAAIAPPVQPFLRVTTRQFSLLEMVEREWGSEFSAPDHRVYSFGGGRRYFDSTDLGSTGIYQKPGSSAGGA